MTPDPGVLEVNLPPASNWDELERVNTLLAEGAKQNRLTAEKFAYDGSHLATGGGSHIVIGGATVMDSPLLRRPDLLRSMVSFWQNHPSLSYLVFRDVRRPDQPISASGRSAAGYVVRA